MIAKSIFKEMPPHRISIAHSRAARNIAEFRESILREYGLTSPEWFVLGHVSEMSPKGGVRVGDIATAMDVQSTYVTGTLRKLEAKELVKWYTDATDKRVRIMKATKKGFAVVDAVEAEIVKQLEVWLGKASDAAFRSYLSVLEIVAEGPKKDL